jgi:hypothetical protein
LLLSNQTSIFLAVYIRVARAVRAAGGINVWAPNVLDCWGPTDDPYGPYFPFEDPSTVDVVGMSFYHIDNTYQNTNDIPAPNKLVDTLMGWNLRQRIYYPNCNYLARFPDAYGKEFHMTETGAVYHAGKGGAAEIDIKRGWWNQLYNGTNIDLLGMSFVGWFEVRFSWDGGRVFVLSLTSFTFLFTQFYKFEYGNWRDFRLASPSMLESFKADLPYNRFRWTD